MPDETAKFSPHETSVNYVMLSVLVRNGMSVGILGEVLGVERKALYGLLDRGEPLAETRVADRLADVYAALHEETGGPLRFLLRMWERELPGGSLKSLLMAHKIDQAAVAVAIDALRPAAMQAMQREEERLAREPKEKSSASLLTLHLEASAGPARRP